MALDKVHCCYCDEGNLHVIDVKEDLKIITGVYGIRSKVSTFGKERKTKIHAHRIKRINRGKGILENDINHHAGTPKQNREHYESRCIVYLD